MRLRVAAEAIQTADAILIGAGAGMSVDSGLPDFRGNEGFWKAYPPFRGRKFAEISNPAWFRRDPRLAWGFFGHRLNLYQTAIAHPGYRILRQWISVPKFGGFVFTSNVDGQFEGAGFAPDSMVECHGSIHRLQCALPCRRELWATGRQEFAVDPQTFRAIGHLPTCPHCGGVARPNILMFGDWDWVEDFTALQLERFREWQKRASVGKIVALECGAGLAIPTVRNVVEQTAEFVIRINPREYSVTSMGVGIPLGAQEALERLNSLLGW